MGLFFNFRKKFAAQNDIISLLHEKGELTVQLNLAKQQLEHERREHKMKLAEELENQRLGARRKEAEAEIKATEMEALLRLDAEQRIKQAELDYERKLNQLKTEHSAALTAHEAKVQADYYKRLQDALDELHSKGNVSTKFLQEIAVKMMEGSGKMNRSRVRVETKQLTDKQKS